MFYTFHQNNSFGIFKGPAQYIIIEADNPEEANEIAERHGVYFNGYGDCPCCGYRWHPTSDYDKEEKPLIYSDAPEEFASTAFRGEGTYKIPVVMVVYKNGTITKFGF